MSLSQSELRLVTLQPVICEAVVEVWCGVGYVMVQSCHLLFLSFRKFSCVIMPKDFCCLGTGKLFWLSLVTFFSLIANVFHGILSLSPGKNWVHWLNCAARLLKR